MVPIEADHEDAANIECMRTSMVSLQNCSSTLLGQDDIAASTSELRTCATYGASCAIVGSSRGDHDMIMTKHLLNPPVAAPAGASNRSRCGRRAGSHPARRPTRAERCASVASRWREGSPLRQSVLRLPRRCCCSPPKRCGLHMEDEGGAAANLAAESCNGPSSVAEQCLPVRTLLCSAHCTLPEMQPLGSSANTAGHRQGTVTGPTSRTCAAGLCSLAASATTPSPIKACGSSREAADESWRPALVSAAAVLAVVFAGRAGELIMLGGCGAGTVRDRYGAVSSSLVWSLCFFAPHPDERTSTCGFRVLGMHADAVLATQQPACVHSITDLLAHACFGTPLPDVNQYSRAHHDRAHHKRLYSPDHAVPKLGQQEEGIIEGPCSQVWRPYVL